MHWANSGENWEYNEAVHQLFTDCKKAVGKLRGRSCVLLPFSLAFHKIGKAIKNVSE